MKINNKSYNLSKWVYIAFIIIAIIYIAISTYIRAINIYEYIEVNSKFTVKNIEYLIDNNVNLLLGNTHNIEYKIEQSEAINREFTEYASEFSPYGEFDFYCNTSINDRNVAVFGYGNINYRLKNDKEFIAVLDSIYTITKTKVIPEESNAVTYLSESGFAVIISDYDITVNDISILKENINYNKNSDLYKGTIVGGVRKSIVDDSREAFSISSPIIVDNQFYGVLESEISMRAIDRRINATSDTILFLNSNDLIYYNGMEVSDINIDVQDMKQSLGISGIEDIENSKKFRPSGVQIIEKIEIGDIAVYQKYKLINDDFNIFSLNSFVFILGIAFFLLIFNSNKTRDKQIDMHNEIKGIKNNINLYKSKLEFDKREGIYDNRYIGNVIERYKKQGFKGFYVVMIEINDYFDITKNVSYIERVEFRKEIIDIISKSSETEDDFIIDWSENKVLLLTPDINIEQGSNIQDIRKNIVMNEYSILKGEHIFISIAIKYSEIDSTEMPFDSIIKAENLLKSSNKKNVIIYYDECS